MSRQPWWRERGRAQLEAWEEVVVVVARTGSEGGNVVFDSGVETVTESRGRPLGTK